MKIIGKFICGDEVEIFVFEPFSEDNNGVDIYCSVDNKGVDGSGVDNGVVGNCDDVKC